MVEHEETNYRNSVTASMQHQCNVNRRRFTVGVKTMRHAGNIFFCFFAFFW